MNLPFVSIVVAVRNGKHFVKACAESLLALNYPKDQYEIFIVDNGSTDGTADEIRKYPVKFLSRPRPFGPSAPRNLAIGQVRGEWIAITDIDCVADPDWLLRLMEGWEDPRYGALVGCVKSVETDNPIEQWMAPFYDQENNLKASPFPFAQTNNVAYRWKLFIEIGGFDEGMHECQDLEFSARIFEKTKYQYKWNPDALIYHRNRANMKQVCKKFFGRGYGIAKTAKRVPAMRKPPIFLKALHHVVSACEQFAKWIVRLFKKDEKENNAALQHCFWLIFHVSMFAGLIVGACDFRNNRPIIPDVRTYRI